MKERSSRKEIRMLELIIALLFIKFVVVSVTKIIKNR